MLLPALDGSSRMARFFSNSLRTTTASKPQHTYPNIPSIIQSSSKLRYNQETESSVELCILEHAWFFMAWGS